MYRKINEVFNKVLVPEYSEISMKVLHYKHDFHSYKKKACIRRP